MSWQTCYSTSLELNAHLVKGYLEQFGVPCLLDTGRFGMKHLTFGGRSEVNVLVREDFLHVAQGLLRGREEQDRRRLRVIPGGRSE